MASTPKIDNQLLRSACDIIAATEGGLTGTEIFNLLKDCNITDVSPSSNKRTRLYDALTQKQNDDRSGNNVFAFFQKAMNPASYVSTEDMKAAFDERRYSLNKVFSLMGMQINESGQFQPVQPARNISEAENRANELRKKLINRNVHHEVLKYCKKELLQDNNYFHSVLEASKSIAQRIRDISGLKSDGAQLVDDAFSLGASKKPKFAFNALANESEESEHKGFINLCKGFFGLARNLTAHAPKLLRKMEEEEALDYLVIASRIHKILDKSVRTGFI